MTNPETMDVAYFVRKMKHISDAGGRFAFFIGAGCSISSGIPAAGQLVNRWLKKLHEVETGNKTTFDEWVTEKLPGYSKENPAASYASVMQRLFSEPPQRRREVERFALGKDPAFGYAVLANLVSHSDFAQSYNLLLTTNFDDLIADALYLYTRQKPLVIAHESLAGFVAESRSRPVVIKLHGDALLDPKSLENETATLDSSIQEVLSRHLKDRGLVFLGYGGNDQSINEFLRGLPADTLNEGVYWVNDHVPENDFGEWIRTQAGARWVNHLSFDELMLIVFQEFGLTHPEQRRFDTLLTTYHKTFSDLNTDIETKVDSDLKETLKSAAIKTEEEFKDWRSVEYAARRAKENDLEAADAIYQRGLEKFSNSAPLLSNYALFLQDERKKMDEAEEYYGRALEADPTNANTLNNYARFLENERKKMDEAEEYYGRAIEADPTNANTLNNYALFLQDERKKMDEAEAYYGRAVEADPTNAATLNNYARFLQYERKKMDEAEEYFGRALEADPTNVTTLNNYARFLQDERKKMDEAEEHFVRALEADPTNASILNNYAGFLQFERKKMDEAEEYLVRALEADPTNAIILNNYARFLQDERKKMDEAEEYLVRALEADPTNAIILNNYARFLQNERKKMDEAEEYYGRALEADPTNAVVLHTYGYFLQTVRKKMDEAEENFKRSLQLNPADSNTMCNYAGFLLMQGKAKEGNALLKSATTVALEKGDKVVLLKCSFFAYAHASDAKRFEALKRLKELISNGVRKRYFNFSMNIERAKKSGRTDIPFLTALAAVITQDVDASTLDQFDEWRGAA